MAVAEDGRLVTGDERLCSTLQSTPLEYSLPTAADCVLISSDTAFQPRLYLARGFLTRCIMYHKPYAIVS